MLSVRLFAEFFKDTGQPLTIDASRDDVRAFINSASTASVRFKSLQQFFKFCTDEGEPEVSPMAGMQAPTINRGARPS